MANSPKQIPIISFISFCHFGRPGNQINRTVKSDPEYLVHDNPAARLQGPAQPAFKCNSSDFWTQGINVALTFRF